MALREAMQEASRCLRCGECVAACPLGNPIPDMMALILSSFQAATDSITQKGPSFKRKRGRTVSVLFYRLVEHLFTLFNDYLILVGKVNLCVGIRNFHIVHRHAALCHQPARLRLGGAEAHKNH